MAKIQIGMKFEEKNIDKNLLILNDFSSEIKKNLESYKNNRAKNSIFLKRFQEYLRVS